jgi:16S rRNA processing protein RimM
MTTEELLLIGTIGAPFGIRGQLKLHAVTSRPEYLVRRLKTVFLGKERREAAVTRLAVHKPNLLILTLSGIADRDTAGELRGQEVYIRPGDAAPLGDDEYFIHDLIGLQVETSSGESVGEVRDVLETGAGEIVVISRPDRADALVPLVRALVPTLDIAGRRMVVDAIPGLLD